MLMTQWRLLRAWALLAALTAFSTALHLSPLPGGVSGCLILGAAWIKSRVILLDYLELGGVAHWAAGLQMGLAALILVFAVLFLAA